MFCFINIRLILIPIVESTIELLQHMAHDLSEWKAESLYKICSQLFFFLLKIIFHCSFPVWLSIRELLSHC